MDKDTCQVELSELIETMRPPKNEFPFFLMAYWPSGGWWKIFPTLYDSPDNDTIRRDMDDLVRRGWAYVSVIRLPEP